MKIKLLKTKIMKCPVCDVVLLMSEKQGVEIDYCPECRGIWLDKGDLEKIIEGTIGSNNQSFQSRNEDDHNYSRSSDEDRYDSNGTKNGRKRNFFSDLFD